MADEPRWTLEDVQRVLYEIVTKYEWANGLGRDDEFLRDAIRIGKQTLQDNHWWPLDDPQDIGCSPPPLPPIPPNEALDVGRRSWRRKRKENHG